MPYKIKFLCVLIKSFYKKNNLTALNFSVLKGNVIFAFRKIV